MKNLVKKIVVPIFAIGAMLLFSNDVFAENYKVNIAVLGDVKVGKTQIIRRITEEPFQLECGRTCWNMGAYGKEKQYKIEDDLFECNYYDAPGYLMKDNATVDEQINSKAIKDANIALLVYDPQQKEGIQQRYVHSLHEAMQRHADNIRAVNPNCKIIVVANKIDRITDTNQLNTCKGMLEVAPRFYPEYDIDYALTSAKTDEGIPELEGKIINLLKLKKSQFPTFKSTFIICGSDGKQQREDRSVKGKKGVYCSEGCLRVAEGEPCAYTGCTNKKTFLEIKGEGYRHKGSDKVYCDKECFRKAEGEVCAGFHGILSELSLNPHKEKFIRADGEGYISPHTNKLYCTKDCYLRSEGTRCCYNKCKSGKSFFVVEDNEGFVRSKKNTGKTYCQETCRHNDEDWCVIV